MFTKLQIPIFLFLLTFLVYFYSSRGEAAHLNYFVPLADAFLHGRTYLLENPSWLNELIDVGGRYYVVYPPMPAILLMPFVAIFGNSFYQPYGSILFAAISVSLCYLVIKKLFDKKTAIWISILYAFGTMQWFHAEVGSAWYLAHIVALLFLWLAIVQTVIFKNFFLAGLFIGAAYLSRLPTVLGFLFILVYLHERFFSNKAPYLRIKNLTILGLSLLPAILFNAFYNYIRYGVVYDISYFMLPVFDEPWYKYGLFNIRYLPTHLGEIFFSLPKISTEFPYIIPSLRVMALWFVTPAFLLIPFAKFKSKIVLASLVSIFAIGLVVLTHGSNGFSQFGFRFALDFHPFLLILVASAIYRKINWAIITLIILSILINFWGVVMISRFGISTF